MSDEPTLEARIAALEAGKKLLWQRLKETQKEQADHAHAVGRTLIEVERKLNARLDMLDKRLQRVEPLADPLPQGELDLYGAYQLIVNELAAVKKAVIGLQRAARDESAAPDAADLTDSAPFKDIRH